MDEVDPAESAERFESVVSFENASASRQWKRRMPKTAGWLTISARADSRTIFSTSRRFLPSKIFYRHWRIGRHNFPLAFGGRHQAPRRMYFLKTHTCPVPMCPESQRVSVKRDSTP